MMDLIIAVWSVSFAGVVVGIIAKFAIVDRLVKRFETTVSEGSRREYLMTLPKRAIKALRPDP